MKRTLYKHYNFRFSLSKFYTISPLDKKIGKNLLSRNFKYLKIDEGVIGYKKGLDFFIIHTPGLKFIHSFVNLFIKLILFFYARIAINIYSRFTIKNLCVEGDADPFGRDLSTRFKQSMEPESRGIEIVFNFEQLYWNDSKASDTPRFPRALSTGRKGLGR